MLRNGPEIEIIPLTELEDNPQKAQHPWKLYLITVLTVVAFILVNVYPPIKAAFYDFGIQIHSYGLLGPLLFLLFNGVIVIPLGLPYPVFEMAIAFLIPNYLYAVSFSTAARMLGALVCYFLTKYLLRQKIRDSFKGVKVYKGIEHVVEKNPIKFSLILRITAVPLFIKNYGLAIPDSVNFMIYMACSLITSIPLAAFTIYICKEAGDFSNIFGADQTGLQKGFAIAMLIISILVMAYLVVYTKRFMRELEGMSPEEEIAKNHGKDIESGTDLKPNSGLEIKSSNEVPPMSNKTGMVELQEESHVIEDGKGDLDYDKITAF